MLLVQYFYSTFDNKNSIEGMEIYFKEILCNLDNLRKSPKKFYEKEKQSERLLELCKEVRKIYDNHKPFFEDLNF